MLLKSSIKTHEAYHDQIEQDLKTLFSEQKVEEDYVSFKFPGVKGSDRALIKLKESVKDFKIKEKTNKQKKFKLDTLKDLTRGSFVFYTATQLTNFF